MFLDGCPCNPYKDEDGAIGINFASSCYMLTEKFISTVTKQYKFAVVSPFVEWFVCPGLVVTKYDIPSIMVP
jgi:hypothetical protein